MCLCHFGSAIRIREGRNLSFLKVTVKLTTCLGRPKVQVDVFPMATLVVCCAFVVSSDLTHTALCRLDSSEGKRSNQTCFASRASPVAPGRLQSPQLSQKPEVIDLSAPPPPPPPVPAGSYDGPPVEGWVLSGHTRGTVKPKAKVHPAPAYPGPGHARVQKMVFR